MPQGRGEMCVGHSSCIRPIDLSTVAFLVGLVVAISCQATLRPPSYFSSTFQVSSGPTSEIALRRSGQRATRSPNRQPGMPDAVPRRGRVAECTVDRSAVLSCNMDTKQGGEQIWHEKRSETLAPQATDLGHSDRRFSSFFALTLP